ncbi:uncharacterized protein MONOS_3523 [Monocercomonoides exilis]|uniref:uncharacterized protein n=1 Tax=Monocercomonoides exilis TaxID=2049356 RepID=UPI00355A3845|nr:hypothetical protein MONOS_3523 [Monocercomonoides exilis]|eukprot:MONOS_3523.1-p1 / transcript=MONOS_3523.1 / gene=MONOS_3523 / organism=Monocercomonoides_exilis_PA203 / gene_product=unspecified product / transcript_product=unspecified product / location=Mono_scaffold00083:98769-100013(+) / protein_length=415 / sequence_SO=supercontig / SO=protein_coding / is_pseudo=false
MEKDEYGIGNVNVPPQIREFATKLSEGQKTKCLSLFSSSAPNLPMPTELERFSESLSVLEKADFWRAVSQIQTMSTNVVPLPSLPTSDNVNAYPAAPAAFEEVNNSVSVVDEVSCDPPTNSGASAPKNKWELSFIAPIMDEVGIPSRKDFFQLMKGTPAVKNPESEKTPFLRSTDVQREVARKSIENNTFLSDKCLEEDQKTVITEFKRVWAKEKKRVACNKKCCINETTFSLYVSFAIMIGYGLILGGSLTLGAEIPVAPATIMIVLGAIVMIITIVMLCCSCCATGFRSLGAERDLSAEDFWSDLKGSMRPCVERRDKDWRRKKEWRWVMTRSERKEEEKIDKEEEARKKKEENEKLSREAAIEMEKLQMKQAMSVGAGGTGNVEFTNQAYSASVAVEVEPRTTLKGDEYHY